MYREDAIETGPLGNIGEHRVRLTEKEAQLYLRTVLQLCAAGKLRCSEKTMRPSSVTISTLVSHLAGGDFYLLDPIASFAWPLLVQAGGLANLEGGRLQLTRKAGPRCGSRRWRSSERCGSAGWPTRYRRVQLDRGDQGPARPQCSQRGQTTPPGGCRRVGRLPARRVARRGHPVRDHATAEHEPRDRPQPDGAVEAIPRRPQYGSLGYDGFHAWEILEGRYTLAVLFEYAGTLGLLDLDYIHPIGGREDFQDNWGWEDLDALSRYDGLQAIRLTALGCYALGLTDSYQPPAGDEQNRTLKVLPKLDVVTTGTLPGRSASAVGLRRAHR
jgi:hypothetical protein